MFRNNHEKMQNIIYKKGKRVAKINIIKADTFLLPYE